MTEPYVPGTELVTGSVSPALAWAVAICKDLDFPDLVRANRQAGADVLLVSAWDFDRDGWLHSRMALVRGVENGVTIARTARSGALTITDPWGRVLAEDSTGTADVVTVAYDVPRRSASTVFTMLGPWFSWLCLALVLSVLARLAFRRRPDEPTAHAGSPDEPSTTAPGRPLEGSTPATTASSA